MAFGVKTRRSARRRAAPTTWHLEGGGAPSLYGWVAVNMAKGAGYAALLTIAVLGFILLIRALSFLLPEDPYAALDAGRALVATALV